MYSRVPGSIGKTGKTGKPGQSGRPENPGIPSRPAQPGGAVTGGREPSYRHSVRVPYNYSGNAFRKDAPSSELIPPPTVDDHPYFDDLPRVSGLTEASEHADPDALDGGESETVSAVENSEHAVVPVPSVAVDDRAASARPTGLLSVMDGTHFPFGHGLGYEELLLLGLMVFLTKECDGEGDLNETLLLLGILLLCG